MAAALDELLQELLSSGQAELLTVDSLDTDLAPGEVSPTRRRIAAAAIAVFAERSYEGATTRAIADRAGVTERTLFKHFPSKDQLFARTIFPTILAILQPLTVGGLKQVLLAHQGDFRATLRAIVAERIRFATRHPGLIAMLVRELLSRPAFRTAVRRFFETELWPPLRAMLDEARENGQIRDLPSEVALRAIVGQVIVYVVPRIILEDEGPWDDALEIDRIVDLVLHGLGVAGPGSPT